MRVLYLEGDPNGIRYVSGTLTRMGIAHEVVRPGGPLPRDLSHYQAAIVSDFPRAQLHDLEPLLARAVNSAGLGLMMVGGWRSFGRGGYASSLLGDLLPVEMLPGDDRANVPSGIILEPAHQHPVLRGLDWSRPIVVCGHNRVLPKSGTSTILIGHTIEGIPGSVYLGAHRIPLLVVKEAEERRGRIAALATDLAPHWSGGLTDWGSRHLEIGDDEQVGEDYATFVMNLVRWIAGEDTVRRPLPAWEEMAEIPALESRPTLRCAT